MAQVARSPRHMLSARANYPRHLFKIAKSIFKIFKNCACVPESNVKHVKHIKHMCNMCQIDVQHLPNISQIICRTYAKPMRTHLFLQMLWNCFDVKKWVFRNLRFSQNTIFSPPSKDLFSQNKLLFSRKDQKR